MSLFARHPHPPVLSILLSPKTQLDITLRRSIFAADRKSDSLDVFDCGKVLFFGTKSARPWKSKPCEIFCRRLRILKILKILKGTAERVLRLPRRI